MTDRRRTARDVLNELRWREDRNLGQAEIWYADRVKPEGYKVIRGSDIAKLGRGYFCVEDSMLPYYKVLRIVYGDEVLFERNERPSKTTK